MFDYHPRPVQSLSPILIDDYRMKRYELSVAEPAVDKTFSDDNWRAFLAGCLPRNGDAREHRVGFAILHYAQDGNYLLVSRWYGGNMLKHEAFTLTQAANGWSLDPLLESRIVACVWELEVMSFERDAWVRTAMAQHGSAPSLELYLDSKFRGWV